MDANKKKKDDTPLGRAMKYLKNQGIIDKQQEVADALGMSKGTLSQYINGQEIPSGNFRTKFEEKYRIKLVQFEHNGVEDPAQVRLPIGPVKTTLADYILLLQSSNSDKDKIIKALEKLDEIKNIVSKIYTSSDGTKAKLDDIVDEVRAEHAVMMDSLDRLEKNAVGTNATKAGNLEIDRRTKRTGEKDKRESGGSSHIH